MRKLLIIKSMKAIAEEQGGKCLSIEYVNAKTKLSWQCVAGHTWEATPDKIRRGSWCPYCAGNIKLNIEAMRQLAMGRSGKCLSNEYINSSTKLLWKCETGHQWEATPSKVKSGQWCPTCARKKRSESQKGTLKEMNEIAKERGGKCLSDIYINANSKLKWQCSEGHIWEATPGNIKSGKWCAICGGNVKSTIEEMQKIANKQGRKCLSKHYKNANSKLLWECEKKHKWEATPSHVKRGTWCPVCAGEIPITIEDMHNLAHNKGGKCLSDIYVNTNSKLAWQCGEGHIWEAVPSSIKGGSWCPNCAGNITLNIDAMYLLAEERGGKCLSDIYVNAYSKLTWQCSEGHIWEAVPSSIKGGSWCPNCGTKNRTDALRLNIKELHKLAEERGGKCLCENYRNTRQKLLWECAEGHRWEANTNDIKRGRWCPICSMGLGERICREFFERLFKSKFPKSYPRWLTNKKGKQMELDGYCEPLSIAFEHQGEQHYSLRTPFIKSETKLSERQADDELKIELCKQNNVVLIAVPEILNRLPVDKIKDFIKGECRRNKISLPEDIDDIKIDLRNIYNISPQKKAFKEMRQIASQKGGRCLSDGYISSHTKLLWKCRMGHQWEATPHHIRLGTWCPICGGTTRLELTYMHILAEDKRGKCLSVTYVNARTKLLWECEEGHQWEATANKIKNGRWCPTCGIKKRAESQRGTLENMVLIAKERGGKCLSDIYVNANSKLTWLCSEGHKWEATSGNIKSGKWCAVCARNKRRTTISVSRSNFT